MSGGAAQATRLPMMRPATGDQLADDLAAQRSRDIVIGIVAHDGSGASKTTAWILKILSQRNYLGEEVRLSRLIEEAATAAGLSVPPRVNESKADRTRRLQEGGHQLRLRHGDSITAGLAVADIRRKRAGMRTDVARVFVLDSLKHPSEVAVLRQVYGTSFYLLAVTCHESTRVKRLKGKYSVIEEGPIRDIIRRDDADPKNSTGPNVRKTLHLADYFLNNDSSTEPSELDVALSTELERFVDIITGAEPERPKKDERGMHAAWVASLASSCKSRQVGAAILDDAGNLLATGQNDVPRAFGGLYSDDDPVGSRHRCFESENYCRNDDQKDKLVKSLAASLRERKLLGEDATEPALAEALRATRLKDLIEFSRAVHAEMDAIISLARRGSGSSAGATLYSRTYPCHSCARHIVAAGIAEVVYIEPYVKSLAVELHGDAIEEGPKRTLDQSTKKPVKVWFRLFSGVAPRRYAAIFESRTDKSASPTKGSHIEPIMEKSFLELEERVAKIVESDVVPARKPGEGA